MSWRRISYKITQYLAIVLFIFTILLTTPWGTKLTLVILDQFDSVSVDYRGGSLVRDVQLNSFRLTMNNVDISVSSFATKIDFSCIWKKTLCIKSVSADDLVLRYTTGINDVSTVKTANTLFEMPFAIKIDTLTLKKANIAIDKTTILIEELQTKLAVKQSQFSLLQPSVNQISIQLENTPEAVNKHQPSVYSMADIIATLPDLNLPISLAVEKLSINNLLVVKKLTAHEQNQVWQSSNNYLSATWLKTDIRIRQFKATTPNFSITEFTANAKLTSPYQINSNVESHINNLPLWPEIADSSQKLSIQGSLEDLNIDISSTGNLAFNSVGHLNLIHPDMPFSITVDADKMPLPSSLIQYGKPASLSITMTGDLQKQRLELASELTSYGYRNAQVKLAATHQEGVFNIDELLINEENSASQLSLQGNVAQLPSAFTWQVSMYSTGISLPIINMHQLTELLQVQDKISDFTSTMPNTLSGRLQGRITSEGAWSDSKWQANITDTDISGTLNNIPLKIQGDIGLTPAGHITQGELLVVVNNSELTLHSANNAFWDLTGNLTVNNLEQWYQEAKGSFTSDFSIIGTKGNPTIRLNAEASGVNWSQWRSNTLNIQGVYLPQLNHQIELTLNNDHLTWTNKEKVISAHDITFKLSGDAKQHELQAHWLGDISGQLDLTGQLDTTLTRWHSTIEKSTVAYKNISLTNAQAFELQFNFASATGIISSHCWESLGVSACLPREAVIGRAGDIAAKVTVDLSAIDELFLPKDIDLISQLQGDVVATWLPQQSIKAKADFNLLPGYIKVSDEFSEHTLSQWSQGLLSVAFNGEQLTNKIQLTDINNQPLININTTLKLMDNFPVDAQIILHEIDLQPFQPMLSKVVNLQGKLTTNIAVNGTLTSPMINGDIKLNHGKIKFEQNANVIDNLSTTLVIKNNKASLLGNFFLEDKEAMLAGQLSWQDSLVINLDLTAKTIPLAFPPQLIMNISPTLNFSFADNALVVSGNVDVLEGSYNIDKLPEDSVPLSDDVIIVDQDGQVIVKNTVYTNISTKVNVNIAKAFTVSGQGLKSHLFGQLQINQEEKQPLQLYGRIQSDNGVFQAYGQKLQIEKGDLTFNGPTTNPYIDLRASKKIPAEDITVGMQVSGLADALTMQLISSPVMQTPEILSYLVRGRGLDADTENSTTAAGLLVGMSLTNNIGLFEQIEKLPLINNLAVDTEGVGEQTQATVSGYVGNRVYLKYGIGVYEPINELTVRMYMFNRFWLEIVSGIEKSTDIYYSFDIE